ncbi:hypothetical protein K402DRAFT_10370 [Aulographum hederae CBS 113979]|uniref:F-box domain-containing protein n=1 Tax=Aulographum hederae CBS 113979 TaxID=1176131 RepID=A0A6G1HHH8_9PEZI|nr:hypothetical protein K402DRAFT_10370 [Aulographum hederae CBS 113979]
MIQSSMDISPVSPCSNLNTSHMDLSAKPFPFLGLPGELRNKIYMLILFSDVSPLLTPKKKSLPYSRHPEIDIGTLRQDRLAALLVRPIFQVSSRVRAEAQSIFYTNSDFCCEHETLQLRNGPDLFTLVPEFLRCRMRRVRVRCWNISSSTRSWVPFGPEAVISFLATCPDLRHLTLTVGPEKVREARNLGMFDRFEEGLKGLKGLETFRFQSEIESSHRRLLDSVQVCEEAERYLREMVFGSPTI